MKQPGMFLWINISFLLLLGFFHLIQRFLSWEFYAFWFIFYLELMLASWVSAESEEPIRYKFTYFALGGVAGLTILYSLVLFFTMPRPYFLVSIIGFLLCLTGLTLEYFGMKNLGFCFSEHVKIPKKLIVSGLYEKVRHPIYSGAILIMIGFPLILNAYYALSASFLYIVLILIRTELEEKSLCRDLIGYEKYLKKTNKFFPKVL